MGRFPRPDSELSWRGLSADFEDGDGRGIVLRAFGNGPVDDERDALLDIYLDYDPSERSLGIPPVRESKIRPWLDRLLDDYCVVAWHDERAVGQAVLLEDKHGAHEMGLAGAVSLSVTVGLNMLVDGVLIGVALLVEARTGLIITVALAVETPFVSLTGVIALPDDTPIHRKLAIPTAFGSLLLIGVTAGTLLFAGVTGAPITIFFDMLY